MFVCSRVRHSSIFNPFVFLIARDNTKWKKSFSKEKFTCDMKLLSLNHVMKEPVKTTIPKYFMSKYSEQPELKRTQNLKSLCYGV